LNSVVTISGPGTKWKAYMTALGDPGGGGASGVNSLIIRNGGTFETDSLIAGGASGNNHVLVTGQNSLLTVSSTTLLGSAAIGTLTIADNARVVATGTFEIGEFGTLNIGAAPGS